MSALNGFARPIADWFSSALGQPTAIQSRGWPPILQGLSTLLIAPTGSGKTLAAFLAALERLMFRELDSPGVRLLYVSPLKALAVDVERNLRSPITGITAAAERLSLPVRVPAVAMRSGDTPAAERARFRRAPSEILITTPESLYLLLTSGAAEHLASVETVIVDEIHAVVGSKRGAHLALCLERLERLRKGAPLQRIGLSATVRPVQEAALLLGGGVIQPDDSVHPRPIEIVDASGPPRLTLRIDVPVEDMSRVGGNNEDRSIWPAIHPQLLELIRQHRSTLIFVNSRRLAERLSASLNEACGEELVLAHHGAIARDRRREIEDGLKLGQLRALVATSSLELGIDMGAIDLVIQIEAPPSVASGLQRIGRAGHQVGGVSEGIIFPKYRGDLLAAAATAEQMQKGAVEALHFPRNPLDVLAQQVVAIASDGELSERELLTLLRGAAPFAALPQAAFISVLDLLSGRYPSDEFAELRPRITWNRVTGRIAARAGARRVAVTNGGTIPDRGLYGVFLATEPGAKSVRVGELDEEMVFESRVGDVFVLGASSWRIEDIGFDRVLVTPAPGEPGKTPFWHGDKPGRPLELGYRVGQLARELLAMKDAEAVTRLSETGLKPRAAKNLIQYLREQEEATGAVPSDRRVIVEEFLDELGDFRVCLLSPFGARVHAPWALACMELSRERFGAETEAVWSDDGIVFRFPEANPPDLSVLLPEEQHLQELLQRSLAKSSLFAAHFRENAARALLLPRRRPGQRTPLWAQRRRAADLLRAASHYPEFPIVLETYRECLQDVFDLPGLLELMRRVRRRDLQVERVNTRAPSPFAASLLFSYAGNFIYNGDAPLAERRAHALTIDQTQLRELLGEAELRSLLDPEVLAELEGELSRSARPLKHADELHDLLLRVGDLTLEEIRARSSDPAIAESWLSELSSERRVIAVNIAGELRHAAAEDASRLRDALGVVPPRGLPAAFLEPVRDPVGDLLTRFARCHGPFAPEAIVQRYGLSTSRVLSTLDQLERGGRLVGGAFLPHGHGREWCDPEVLRRLKQRSLARLRKAVEPVDQQAFARFLLEWQGAAKPRAGRDGLASVLEQLEGAEVVASVFEQDILPARIERYHSAELDALTGSGEFVWRGVESLGPHDGRLAFYRADRFDLLAPPPVPAQGELPESIREVLRRRGASFFGEIVAATRAFPRDVLEAIWTLVFSGEVTNDTLAPVRSRLASPEARDRPRRPNAHRTRTHSLPGSEGRWWLLERWRAETAPSATERLSALSEVMLERYGVLPREALAFERGTSFSDLYPVYKALEEAGKIRRGYFVAGLSATQFARPGADDRLRILREPEERPGAVTLAATDPANPYGSILPWPENGARPQRAAGAHVILRDGALIGYLSRSERALLTFVPPEQPDRSQAEQALVQALQKLVDGVSRRALVIAQIDGNPAHQSAFGAALVGAGFTKASDGYFYRSESPRHGARR